MLRTVCDGPIIEKTRLLVPHAGLTWEVDVHEGALAGLVFAEVGFEHKAQNLVLLRWVGREVAGNPAHRRRPC